jgi:hypothetical protein
MHEGTVPDRTSLVTTGDEALANHEGGQLRVSIPILAGVFYLPLTEHFASRISVRNNQRFICAGTHRFRPSEDLWQFSRPAA